MSDKTTIDNYEEELIIISQELENDDDICEDIEEVQDGNKEE